MTNKDNFSPQPFSQNYTPQNVSSARDFPIACGRQTGRIAFQAPHMVREHQRIASTSNVATGSGNTGPSLKKDKFTGIRRSDSAELKSVGTFDKMVPEGTMENPRAIITSEHIGLSSSKAKLMGKPSSTKAVPVGTFDKKSYDGSEKANTIDVPKRSMANPVRTVEARGNARYLGFVATRKHVVSHPRLENPTSLKILSHSGRRFGSARRDFPQACGSNSSRLSTEEAVKLVASQNMSGSSSETHGGDSNAKKAIWYDGKKSDRDYGSHCDLIQPHHSIALSSEVVSIREMVHETLRRFRDVVGQLYREREAKRGKGLEVSKRIDCKAWRVLKMEGKHMNTGKIIGPIPGVEVGDEFQYKAELSILGLHHSMRGGIDYTRKGDVILATSIVSSGRYDDKLDKDVIIYSGQGGNMMCKNEKAKDQRLVKGNLALANSMRHRNPVRVIRGETSTRKGTRYVYEGLYLVEDGWMERGARGKLVFKFKLRRILGQHELA